MFDKIKFLAFSKPAAMSVVLSLALLQGARAGESASSHYFPGVYNDFFMNLQLDPGFYFRDDLTYYSANISNATTLGRNIATDVDLELWTTTFKLAYVTDVEIFGGRYGAGLFLPVVFDANISAGVESGPFLRGRTVSFETQDNQGGMGDLVVAPLSLTWKWGDVSVNLSEAIFMPTGYYQAGDLVNLGRNYWSFDTIGGLTWLHPTRGHEISFNVGFMSNTENDATQYQSGDEFHLDYTVAQHFSEAFGIGVTGYFYHQLTGDESPLLTQAAAVRNRVNTIRTALGRSDLPEVGDFRGESAGVGPIVRYSPKFGDKQVHFIGKWIHEFNVENRFKGEIGMLSVAMDF
ncbi:transporter [Methylomonas sp. LL1]|uniref:SphA family protein n=1 Tax=Methylomonas sp. LL1 TaxID=2785785 RepID=UPI0018C4375D|nr:transporter [Methylomonas sp. LL1]QPK63569.1 transporter [Methylomonas sp. LL1]